MGQWARWVVVGVVATGAVGLGWDAHVRDVQQRARDAAYEAKIDQLRKIYPVGTLRGEVVKRLGGESTQTDVGQVEMLLGSYAPGGWVCSRWDIYARFVFGDADTVAAEPLVRIQKRERGICL